MEGNDLQENSGSIKLVGLNLSMCISGMWINPWAKRKTNSDQVLAVSRCQGWKLSIPEHHPSLSPTKNCSCPTCGRQPGNLRGSDAQNPEAPWWWLVHWSVLQPQHRPAFPHLTLCLFCMCCSSLTDLLLSGGESWSHHSGYRSAHCWAERLAHSFGHTVDAGQPAAPSCC